MMLRIRVMNEELGHRVMYLRRSRVADRTPPQPLDSYPKIEVVALDVARPSLTRLMAAAWEAPAVGRPSVGAVSLSPVPYEYLPENRPVV